MRRTSSAARIASAAWRRATRRTSSSWTRPTGVISPITSAAASSPRSWSPAHPPRYARGDADEEAAAPPGEDAAPRVRVRLRRWLRRGGAHRPDRAAGGEGQGKAGSAPACEREGRGFGPRRSCDRAAVVASCAEAGGDLGPVARRRDDADQPKRVADAVGHVRRVPDRVLRSDQLLHRLDGLPDVPQARRPRGDAEDPLEALLFSAVVAFAGPRREDHQQPRAGVARDRPAFVRVEGEEAPDAALDRLAAGLDTHRAVDHRHERALLHLMVAERLARLEDDEDRARTGVRTQDDGRAVAAGSVDLAEVPPLHGADPRRNALVRLERP